MSSKLISDFKASTIQEIENHQLVFIGSKYPILGHIYINSCFHVLNAILIIIVLSLYYNRDSTAR